MARKFCTLEEAAGRLSTTEDQLEAMLAEGLLQEFRDGTGRFLRAADVNTLLIKQGPSVQTLPDALLDSEYQDSPAEAEDDEFIEGSGRSTSVLPASRRAFVTGPKPRAKASRRPSRPGLRSWRLSKRQGLWAGVLDDRPLAILAVFILAVLFVAALAAGAYFLSQKL